MPKVSASAVVLSDRQAAILGRMSRSRTIAAVLVERARLLLLASEGQNTLSIAGELGVDRQRVRRWRDRWAAELSAHLCDVEDVGDDRVLTVALHEALSDRERSGAPPKFSADQEERVRAIACRPPSEFDLPHSHWTHPLLAREAVKQGIVDSISKAEIGRWLKKGGSSRIKFATG